MIVIDGSIGEGGGQILRSAIGLAAVLGKPIKIVNIRAKRRNPGLQHQHLTAVKAIAEISNASIDGGYIGSKELVFKPGKVGGGIYRFDIGTAGSTTLVLQALLPILPFLDRETVIEIIGGTDVPWSPPIDYIRYVLIPILRQFGYNVEVELIRRGHYPRGGGIIRIRVIPTSFIEPIDLVDRGDLELIGGRSHCVKLPRHIAERQARAAKEYLASKGLNIPIDIELEFYEPQKDPHLGPGSGIVLYAKTSRSILGGDSLGEKGKPAEVVGREAAEKLYDEIVSGAALDRHAGDMVIPIAAIAKGESRFTVSTITLHMETVVEIAKILTSCEISISRYGDRSFLVRVRGIGIER